jgi:hypothetical protein
VKKVIAGAAILAFPVFALVVSATSYFTYCYDLSGNRLPTADDITNNYGVPVCDNFLLGAPYLLFLLTLWIGGIWVLIFGLTGRSLTTGNKEHESRSPMYVLRVIGGVAILLVSIPFLFQPLTQMIYFCQFPDSIACSIEMNQFLLTLAIVVPPALGATWLIFNGIKKMYPMQTKDSD